MKKSELIPTQPIFATMISGCIKAHQIDRAWDVFDSMRLSYHQPDEVSFTLMLQAAFDLLHQMQNIYGFQADRVTYNTLLSACARKKHLERARDIFQIMVYDAKQHGKDAVLAPDSQTFTNLFLTYASYDPVAPAADKPAQPGSQTDALIEHSLISTTLPERRSHVVQEAKRLFEFVTLEKACEVTSGLLTAYLSVHVMQKQTHECCDIYFNEFDKHGVERTPITFSNMLQFCYDTRDAALAWRIWEDYQTFLEKRQASSALSDKVKEGWAPDQQRQLALLMINTLAR
ncbi:hypothetical protein BX666DRAFT_2019909 [Dichotomocladium elegans]|nr:hypothetical protein BX666DRAFT_2019909 [Dichotomocladium elegans]